ncbi:MAG: putative diguanylate cyclase YdaM [Pelotomaculum sp. PtaB.Bin104]|nr:MAG: putative diguanylate cyclase YdaM [Pelotomaculum sp. PtaB.Bin104]
MQSRQSIMHVIYTWLVAALAAWQLYLLFPALDLDKGRDLTYLIFLGMMAEWLTVSLPQGQLSSNFALVLSTFLIFGPAATAWVSGLATILGLGIANRGVPVRTTLFNACQNVMAAVAAGYIFKLCGGVPGLVGTSNIFPLVAFTTSYIFTNHLLVYFYLLPKRRFTPYTIWLDALKWDGITYLLTVPMGLLVAMIYGYTGLFGILLLFSFILTLQLILRFYVRLHFSNRELTAFYEVARLLEKDPRLEEVLNFVLASVRKVFPYHSGVAYLRSSNGSAFLPVVASGPYSKQLHNTAVYQDEGLIGRTLADRKPVIIFDSRHDPRVGNEAGLCRVMRSLLIIPLYSGKEANGVIVLGEKGPMSFDEKHLHIMVVLGGQAAIAAEKSALSHSLEFAASRDALTGLLISSVFYQAAAVVCEETGDKEAAVGLMLIDVDHFKIFNERYGRLHGDRLLAELAGLIEANISGDELAGRYGGDEFAILLPNARIRRLVDVAARLIEEIRSCYFLEDAGVKARITVSIGIAEFPRDASNAAGLFRAAQWALDNAKKDGRDHVSAAIVSMLGLSR